MNRSFRFIFLTVAFSSGSFQAQVVHIGDEDQYKQALNNNQNMLVEFSADWCSVCNGIKKPFEEIANEGEFNKVAFVQVDVDKLDSVSKQNGIVGVPTFVYMENGNKKVEEIGVQNMPAFKDHLRENIRKTFSLAQNEPIDGQIAPIMEEEVILDVQPAAPNQIVEPNIFMRIFNMIKNFIIMILSKIQGFFTTIIDAIKGFFGG